MEPLHAVLPKALRQLLRQGPMTQEKLGFAWAAAVGPAIARATRVQWNEDGTVEVEAEDQAWARELRRSLPEIRGRLESLVGPGVVAGVRLAAPAPGGRR